MTTSNHEQGCAQSPSVPPMHSSSSYPPQPASMDRGGGQLKEGATGLVLYLHIIICPQHCKTCSCGSSSFHGTIFLTTKAVTSFSWHQKEFTISTSDAERYRHHGISLHNICVPHLGLIRAREKSNVEGTVQHHTTCTRD